MKMKSILIGVLAVAVVVTAGVLGAQSVLAQTNGGTNPLVQRLADTFHLNVADVQKIFDQNKADREVKMQTNFENRLSQLVKDGKINEDQKTKILSKTAELEKARQDSKDLNTEQRRAAMIKTRSDLKIWAAQNGIDGKYLLFRMQGGPGRGPFH